MVESFDEFAKNYDKILEKQHRKFGDINYYAEYKVKILKDFIKKDNLTILEYGCGIGRNFPFFKKYFPESKIYGFDISTESLKIAKKNNPWVEIIYEDVLENLYNFFDLIFIAGVFHHIPFNNHLNIINILRKLVTFKGLICIFEHNPFNPLTKHLVNTCELDKNANLLTKSYLKKIFKKQNFKLLKEGYSLFFPPKLKKLNFLEKYFRHLPFGGQYYVIFEK